MIIINQWLSTLWFFKLTYHCELFGRWTRCLQYFIHSQGQLFKVLNVKHIFGLITGNLQQFVVINTRTDANSNDFNFLVLNYKKEQVIYKIWTGYLYEVLQQRGKSEMFETFWRSHCILYIAYTRRRLVFLFWIKNKT